jgi:F-type H+-transporting ATPase subunit b
MLLPALSLVLAEAAEEKAPPVIDIDGTVVVQFAIFVVMFFVLRSLFFKPYLKLQGERAHHIDGAEAKAKLMEQQALDIEKQYQARMQKARAAADEERSQLQSQGRARETELLTQARERAQARVGETRQQIAGQVSAAQAELEKRADSLAHTLASKLLRREV